MNAKTDLREWFYASKVRPSVPLFPPPARWFFNTGMVGYPEALTDPSYYGQILTSTYPLIGNYGVPDEKEADICKRHWESDKIQAFGFIISNLSDIHSHWNADMSLDEWLKKRRHSRYRRY